MHVSPSNIAEGTEDDANDLELQWDSELERVRGPYRGIRALRALNLQRLSGPRRW